MSEQEHQSIKMAVSAISAEAEGILSCTLTPASDTALPDFAPGAHIDMFLTHDLVRQYSLIGESDGQSYRVAVALDENSRGGSRWVHEHLRVGDTLFISPPRNHFPLANTDELSIFFAGGIGITPIYGMVRKLEREGKPWALHYCARTRKHAAFLADMMSLDGACHPHFDDEQPRYLDIESIVAAAPRGAHFYCCGPSGMMTAFRAATEACPQSQVHLEVFQMDTPDESGDAFTVELARSGRILTVAAGESILDAILKSGGDAPSSCRNGVCGTCETRVLEGEPDHRDVILSDEEKALGDTMMICCSRAKSTRLLLDI